MANISVDWRSMYKDDYGKFTRDLEECDDDYISIEFDDPQEQVHQDIDDFTKTDREGLHAIFRDLYFLRAGIRPFVRAYIIRSGGVLSVVIWHINN